MNESKSKMERPGRRAKAGSLSGLSGGLPSGASGGVRRQRSLEWTGDRYSSSDDDRPAKPPQLADRVFASLLAQATQQFDDEQRRIYGAQSAEEPPRYISSPQRQASPFPLESTNRRLYRRNRNSKGEEIFSADSSTLSRRGRRPDDFDSNGRGARICNINGSGSQASVRDSESPPEPAPPEVPPRGPSLHVTLRHRPCDPPTDSDRLFLSEGCKDGDELAKPVCGPLLSTGLSSSLRKSILHHGALRSVANPSVGSFQTARRPPTRLNDC